MLDILCLLSVFELMFEDFINTFLWYMQFMFGAIFLSIFNDTSVNVSVFIRVMISYIIVIYLTHFVSNSRCVLDDNNLFIECPAVYKNT